MMRRVNVFLLTSVFLLADGSLGPYPCFAGLHALVPSVLKSCVTSISTVFEPRTAASTATSFPGFRTGAAFGAHGTHGRRRSCWCFYASSGQAQKQENHYNMHLVHGVLLLLHVISIGLTFTGLCALKPPVVYVSVDSTSAVLVPSTAGSATTNSARFLKRSTLRTRCGAEDR